MTDKFRLFCRASGVWYLEDKQTHEQESLRTRDATEAKRLFNAKNEAQRQPAINIQIARAYLTATDPMLVKRTWNDVMQTLIKQKEGSNYERWERAINDQRFDSIRKLPLIETRSDHFLKLLEGCKVSSNVYLRRIHNFALAMDWLLKPVIPRATWPKVRFKSKRAITEEEHAAIILREQNSERRDFYELLWHTGAAQSDGACLRAEDINWDTRTICFTRKKLKLRIKNLKPTLFRFSAEIEALLKRRPTEGPLFPYLCTVRASDRATEFKQRCDRLGISGVTLHCYRYAWAERALKCGFPERFAQQALGHNSKAVHQAYAKRASVDVPSLDEWENQMNKKMIQLRAN